MSDEPIKPTQLNSILTISQLSELRAENLIVDREQSTTIFDQESENESVMEISYTPDTSDTKRYMSRRIKTSTLAKGINDVLIKNANLFLSIDNNGNYQLININELLNTVNNIISGDQEFLSVKIFKNNIYKSDNSDDNRYVTSSEVNSVINTKLTQFENSQFISNNISSYINSQNNITNDLTESDNYIAFNGQITEKTANKTGQLIIIGYVNADNSGIDSQFLYTALEIKTSNNDYAIVAIQPYVIPMNGNSLQYFSFNIPIAEGTIFRVRPNFELNEQYGGVPVNSQNLTFTKNNDLVLNGYRWYII